MSKYNENGASHVKLSVTEARGLADSGCQDLNSAIGDAADNAERDGNDFIIVEVTKDEAAAE